MLASHCAVVKHTSSYYYPLRSVDVEKKFAADPFNDHPNTTERCEMRDIGKWVTNAIKPALGRLAPGIGLLRLLLVKALKA